jgi:hypothetical protein
MKSRDGREEATLSLAPKPSVAWSRSDFDSTDRNHLSLLAVPRANELAGGSDRQDE